jgi:hypothetical protein
MGVAVEQRERLFPMLSTGRAVAFSHLGVGSGSYGSPSVWDETNQFFLRTKMVGYPFVGPVSSSPAKPVSSRF